VETPLGAVLCRDMETTIHIIALVLAILGFGFTIFTLYFNRLVSRARESMESVNFFHKRFYEYREAFYQAAKDYETHSDQPERSSDSNRPENDALVEKEDRLRVAMESLVVLMQIEYHSFVRGLVPNDIYSLWLRELAENLQADSHHSPNLSQYENLFYFYLDNVSVNLGSVLGN
jgi:hypothetical protein